MYCYRKDFPQSPLVACGLPLESNSEPVPRHALLLSPLSSLARFHQDWLVFKGWSVRWAGTVPGTSGELYWDLSEEDIALWDPDVQAYQKKIMGEVRFARHTLASLTLLVWASQLIDDGMAAYSLPDLIAH